MEKDLIKIASQVMKVSEKEAEQHCKRIPELDAYYFWTPVRGGIAVIVGANGEKLGATSAVSFDKHVKAFIEGKRN